MAEPSSWFCESQWDATSNHKIDGLGLGAIIRDFEGQVLGTLLASRHYNSNPFTAKAIGLLAVVLFYKDVGFNNLILEGDALLVVDLLKANLIVWSEGSLIISDV